MIRTVRIGALTLIFVRDCAIYSTSFEMTEYGAAFGGGRLSIAALAQVLDMLISSDFELGERLFEFVAEVAHLVHDLWRYLRIDVAHDQSVILAQKRAWGLRPL